MSAIGYMPTAPAAIAPGQLITAKVGLNLPAGTASLLPLPLSINGTSAILYGEAGLDVGQTFNLPLLSVSVDFVYIGRIISWNLATVTVQIPYEIKPASATNYGLYELGVASDSNPSAIIRMVAQADAIHILRTGDSIETPVYGLHPVIGPFPPVITHVNGTTVTMDHPTRPGETVLMWAVGLGAPSSGTVKTGEANPSPALTTTVNIDFDFRSNAGPSMPSATDTGGSRVPAKQVTAYFAPGFVGLYQINVTIPAPPVPLEPCGGIYQSNLTINIGGSASFDGAGICVE
ncbi:MAG: hypothetical protein LAO79_29355 [Acidobacteriia bacterium]|nr:hypothetical protein [Terriglobia bacterium]